MKLTLNILLAFLIFLGMGSCARQSSPMGGPKDEKAPKLVSSSPENESINTKPTELELLFDEFIKVENPTKQIIITPKIKSEEVQFTATRNRLLIGLNQDLQDSTTYVFNFQKSVQDITEGNPSERLKLVFSTGNEIDSLKFSGKVSYVFPQEEKEVSDVLVGLYPINDTTDIFTASPYYIGQADSVGNFEITNIKEGEYKAYAWHDSNNSLKAEFRSEAYGFLSEPVHINENITNVHFNLFRGDLSELKINRSSPTARNYDIILNKAPAELEIIHPDTAEKLFYRITDTNIRLYHREPMQDSTAVKLIIKDSVGFSVDTTVYAKFEKSDREPEKLEPSADGGKGFIKQLRSKLTFNKPVININYDSLFIRYDTASSIPLNPEHLTLLDSAKRTELLVTIEIPDSLAFTTFTVYAADSTFMDVENQWNGGILEANYNKINMETLSEEVSGKVETGELPIILQLLNKNDDLIQEVYLEESNAFSFKNIEAGDYKLRAIIDKNKNKRWDPGNLFEKRQPEPVYYFVDTETNSYQFLIRGGWTLNGIVISPEENGTFKEQQEQ